jgi:hypothetical protein
VVAEVAGGGIDGAHGESFSPPQVGRVQPAAEDLVATRRDAGSQRRHIGQVVEGAGRVAERAAGEHPQRDGRDLRPVAPDEVAGGHRPI